MNDYSVLQPITRKELKWQLEAFVNAGGAIKKLRTSQYYPKKFKERSWHRTFIKHTKYVDKYGPTLSQDVNEQLNINTYAREGVSWNF